MVVSLEAPDEFLKNRVMNLPESVVAGTHNTEEGKTDFLFFKLFLLASGIHEVASSEASSLTLCLWIHVSRFDEAFGRVPCH